MTQAAIVSGSVPGSTSRLATFVTSIAMLIQVLLVTTGRRRLPGKASLSGLGSA
jgi:hypothetical protein